MHNPIKSSITIKHINALEFMIPLRNAWTRLYHSAGCSSPTMTFSWIHSFLENPPDHVKSWKILLAHENDELVGVLPVIETSSKPGLETPFDWHTISVDFLLKSGREFEIIEVMVEHLSSIYPRWSHLILRRIPESSPVVAAATARPSCWRRFLEYNGRGSYLEIQNNFESFYSGLSKNFRKNLKKSIRHMESLGSVSLKVIKGREITEHDIDRFLKLESSGWKGQSGSAIGKSSRLIAFYKSLCLRLADDNILEWHFLQTDTDLLAAQMAFRIGNRLTINKIAYNESFSHYSPGNYLFLKTVENTYNTGDIREIDCLTDMSWHRNWELDRRNYFDIHIFPDTLSSFILGVFPLKMKTILKKTRMARAFRDNLGFLRFRQ